MPLIVLIMALALLFALVQVGAVTLAFDKLGLSAGSGMLLLISSLVGSGVNLPLFQLDARAPMSPEWRARAGWLSRVAGMPLREDKVIVAVNAGGGLIPVAFSAYLIGQHTLPWLVIVIATMAQASICYLVSRPIPGVGVGMPVFVAPLSAALIAVIAYPEASAPLAYICGTLGVLVGADLMRLGDIRHMGSPLASIGGAGTFDGIFITGIVAVLLA